MELFLRTDTKRKVITMRFHTNSSVNDERKNNGTLLVDHLFRVKLILSWKVFHEYPIEILI